MTDHKTWRWRKKSSEKVLVAADKLNLSSRGHEEEKLLTEKAKLEGDLKILNEKFSSALSECNTKDEILRKHEKMAQEAIAGWEKAEAEAVSLKQALEKALNQKIAGEERVAQVDAALKECMQQLRFIREEKEQRIHDAIMTTTREFEETELILKENLEHANQKIAKLVLENTTLSKTLLVKEKSIEDLNQHKDQKEADLNALMARLDSTEKSNASLTYEVRVLEKELEIRNEEKEFNRRTADASHKQHLESVKKIAKLESECQRLRVLVRKRLPGPASLVKMKKEINILENDSLAMRRRFNLTTGSTVDFATENALKNRIDFLTEQLISMEEENKKLKESLNGKTNELHLHSKLSRVDSQITDSLISQKIVPNEPYMASASEIDSDDKVSCTESWASALVSELENFTNEKVKATNSWKTVGVSEINLMDDFAEMEKLAIVSVGKPFVNSHVSSDESKTIIPAADCQSRFNVKKENAETIMDLSEEGAGISLSKGSKQQDKSNLSKAICRIIELIEGITLPPTNYETSGFSSGENGKHFPYENSETHTGYMVRFFQWKTSELSSVLQQFVHTCHGLLNGNADMDKFADELTSALDWIINHCFSIQDVSSMRDAIKKHFDLDETRSESEIDVGIITQFSDADKLTVDKESLSLIVVSNGDNISQMEEMDTGDGKKGGRLKDESIKFEKSNASLQIKSKASKQEGNVEDPTENQKYMNDELEGESNRFKELEATDLDLQLQLESAAKEGTPKYESNQKDKQLRADWEISAASEKLAECQEAILNLGKQFKALSSPNNAALFDKVISTPTDTTRPTTDTTTPEKDVSKHSPSLLDQMLAEDDTEAELLGSPKTKEIVSTSNFQNYSNGTLESQETVVGSNEMKQSAEAGAVGSRLAIVPTSKGKGGGGFLRKLWRRKKKVNNKKKSLPYAT